MFSGFLHCFVLATLVTTSMNVLKSLGSLNHKLKIVCLFDQNTEFFPWFKLNFVKKWKEFSLVYFVDNGS